MKFSVTLYSRVQRKESTKLACSFCASNKNNKNSEGFANKMTKELKVIEIIIYLKFIRQS